MNKQKLPEGWREVELGKIFYFQKKSKIKAGEGSKKGKYKFFTSSDKQTKFINEYNQDGEYLIFATGGHAGVHYCNEKFATSTDCFIVKVDDRVLTKYVYYYLFSKIRLLEDGFKGAGLKHISKGYIQDIKLFYPEDIQTQKAIVSILEKAEKAKEWRKEVDDLTKDFLKSVFLEMFGDPIKNTKNFEKTKISTYAKFQGGFAFKSADYVEEGTSLVKITNVHYGTLSWDEITRVPDTYKKKYSDFLLKEGDLVVAMTRPIIKSLNTVKLIEVKKKDLPCLLNQRVGRFIIKSEKINPIYLEYFCLTDYFFREVDKYCSTSLQPNISSRQIENIDIVVPQIAIQNKFASIVKEVEKLKEHQKKSHEEIDNLFNALMQKAFKGELVV